MHIYKKKSKKLKTKFETEDTRDPNPWNIDLNVNRKLLVNIKK